MTLSVFETARRIVSLEISVFLGGLERETERKRERALFLKTSLKCEVASSYPLGRS